MTETFAPVTASVVGASTVNDGPMYVHSSTASALVLPTSLLAAWADSWSMAPPCGMPTL
jgi:hypothetical protein